MHSNWSELLSVNEEARDERTCRSEPIIGVATTSTAGETIKRPSIPPMKKMVKNIVLVPYTPKPKDWGNWRIKTPYATSNNTSPHMVLLCNPTFIHSRIIGEASLTLETFGDPRTTNTRHR